jgi:zinc protease
MTFLTRLRLTVFAAALMTAVAVGTAQQSAIPPNVAAAKLTDVVPVDPQITVGTLPNGMRYYIRANHQPEARAELRLVVNAGSVLEDDDQRGLAHFVEHMAFNGTTHFQGLDVVNFMQSIGMRFGAHVNANTSFDETIYQLQIPTDNPVVVDRALLVLQDFAHEVTFDPQEIDKERGVILEEWRLGLGADERITNAQFPLLLKGSRYAERLPIGNPDIIRNVNRDRLMQFYKDWYRPDLMAVSIVGDFDKAAMETAVKAHFGALPTSLNAKPRPVYTVPDQPQPMYAVITDPEATNTRIDVSVRLASRPQATIGEYRQHMVEQLFASMMSERLDEIAQQPNAPFLRAATDRDLFVRTEEATTLDALVPTGGVERGLTALFTEVARAERFGFTQTELNREKLNLQRYLQRAVIEKDKSPSGPLADEFIRNFIHGEPIPGIVYEYGLNQRFLPEITLAEVNAVAKDWAPERNRLVVISGPDKDKATLPTEAKIAADIKAASNTAVKAYVDTVSNQPLMAKLPTAGAVAQTKPAPDGITEWTLSNGVHVVLKPTTFKQDEIIFRAVSPGGTSLVSDADYIAAATAPDVVEQGGLGTFSAIDLDKILAGTTAAVRADIGPTEQGLAGGAANKDLETMFQLINLRFTAPRPDPVAFGVFKDRLKVALANDQSMPETVFDQTLTAALTQNHPRAQPLTPDRLNEMNLDKSLAFYKDRFADASSFLFVFVGSFDPATMKPLVERYLGSLPTLHRTEAVKDIGMHPPDGVVEKQVKSGIEPRSQVSIVFSGPFQNDEQHRVIASAMAETLGGNLQRTLREDLGGTYGVSVEPDFQKRPTSEYRLSINFSCDPTRVDDLVAAAFREVDRYKTLGPSASQVADAREGLTRDFQTNSARNEYLLNRLLFKYEYGEDVNDVFNMQPYYQQITGAAMRQAAQQYLNTNRYVKVTLMPDAQASVAR